MKLNRLLLVIATLSLFVILWGIVSRAEIVNPGLFPAPEQATSALIEMMHNGELAADTAASVARLFLGFIFGSVLGIIVGLLTGENRFFEGSAGQLMHFLRFIPPLALVPLAIIWLGIGEISKVGLILWAVFFPVWLSTFIGVRNVKDKHVWAARSLGANNFKVLKEVIIPSCVPFIITGARIGLGIGFSVLIAAEMAGSFSGLGFRIAVSHLLFRVDKMVVDIIILGLIGIIADRIFVWLTKIFIPWHKGEAV
ncbi:ABC transporter permease [Thermoproteota archaeon]